MVTENKEDQLSIRSEIVKEEKTPTSIEKKKSELCSISANAIDMDSVEVCRVCFGTDPDRRGEAALEFLGIFPPLKSIPKQHYGKPGSTKNEQVGTQDGDRRSDQKKVEINRYVEYKSPDGQVFVCVNDLEAVTDTGYRDTLIELGCLYNIKLEDMNKVMSALKECETLRAMTDAGEASSAQTQRHSSIDTQSHSAVDPDAVAAVRRQRLTEIASWFNPQFHTTISQASGDEASNNAVEETVPDIHPATKWLVEGTGILVATGLLTATLAWLIAPRVGKKTAKSGLHILLGGLCVLTAVIFLRFAVLPRIKYGRARYWAIAFVFMFLVFGIWASRTRHSVSH
eukprot:TRINITY_DN2121_c0_g1_i2.p1 TRINITY_DN2121_c0_g1~~TRINITY_DN2121_c0_g1_i2.p1  ORF type:complete len:342 (-),score=78.61 TRINITY_DN2121_c0_g1_i2:168-1193(-)